MDILKGVNPQVKVKQYADDIAVFYRAFNWDYARKEVEKAVNKISRNLLQLGLDTEPRKHNL